jgi:hypothetical protein
MVILYCFMLFYGGLKHVPKSRNTYGKRRFIVFRRCLGKIQIQIKIQIKIQIQIKIYTLYYNVHIHIGASFGHF